MSKHKATLAKLKDQDPEFYKFLESESKELLNFDESASDSEADSDDAKYHKPPQKLQVCISCSSLHILFQMSYHNMCRVACFIVTMVTAASRDIRHNLSESI